MKRSYKKKVMGSDEVETKSETKRKALMEKGEKKRKFIFTKHGQTIEANSLSEAKELLKNNK